MLELLSVAFSISLIVNALLSFVIDSYKKDCTDLRRMNDTLFNRNRFLNDKNQDLMYEISNLSDISNEQKIKIQEIMEKIETYEFPVDSKVTWIDRKGEIETGIVVDDSKIDGVTYVHLRRINNKGKILGGIITVPANKLKLEN